MKLIAGSYERFLFGYQAPTIAESSEPKQLKLAFTYAAHLGPVKCVASSGSVLVSGGSDDIIRIYDIKASRDMGTLMQHEGAVTCLDFHTSQGVPTNLLSGGEDGAVCVWDTIDWQHLKTLKGHRGPVTGLTVHPSGRLALSVSRDGYLRMWNLMKGRPTFNTKLKTAGEIVKFAPQEARTYSIASGNDVLLYSTETGNPLHVLSHEKAVLCLAQCTDRVLLTSGEEPTIRAWDATSGKLIMTLPNAHTNRIRGLAIPEGSSSSQTLPHSIASASSDGSIRVWDSRKVVDKSKPTPLLEGQTNARLTCLTASGHTKDKRSNAIMAEIPRKEDRIQEPSTSGRESKGPQNLKRKPAATESGKSENPKRTKAGASTQVPSAGKEQLEGAKKKRKNAKGSQRPG